MAGQGKARADVGTSEQDRIGISRTVLEKRRSVAGLGKARHGLARRGRAGRGRAGPGKARRGLKT